MRFRRILLAAALIGLWPGLLPAAGPAAPSVGDSWRFRTADGYNGLPRGTWMHTVTGAGADRIRVELRGEGGAPGALFEFTSPGQFSAGRLIPRADGRLEPALQLLAFPLEEGKRWRQRVTRFDPDSQQRRTLTLDGRVAGWETVKVPAGEFRALKVVRVMFLGDHDAFRHQTRLTEHEWYVPELNHWVRLQSWEEYHDAADSVGGSYTQGERLVSELLSFQPAKR